MSVLKTLTAKTGKLISVHCTMIRLTVKLARRLDELEKMILEIAKSDPKTGKIEKSLKWGRKSFATRRPGSDTPIRIEGSETNGTYSLFMPCSTSLINYSSSLHPDMFDYHGNREIRFCLKNKIPNNKLSIFLHAAFTYLND